MPKPKVTVLMTVYNDAQYLEESIQSILRQDYTDFEFLIINDGSTDNSQEILKRYANLDHRINVVKQKNMGLVASLNKGIGLAQGKYIARMDSDDISMTKRLSRQVAFLDSHPEVVLLGGGFEIIDEEGNFLDRIFAPLDDTMLRRSFLLKNPFGHASVMYRKEAAIRAGLYSGNVGPAEDLDLWIRLSKIGNIAALPYSLMRYRINRRGISQTKSKLQSHYTQLLIRHYWKEHEPVVLSRHEIMRTSRTYFKSGPGLFYGLGLKMLFLLDSAQIGVKMIRYRQPINGVRQLFNIASTGRTGLRAVRIRLGHLGLGTFKLAVVSEPAIASIIEQNKEESLREEHVNIPTA